MANTLAFTFESSALTVLGDNLNPLFIAKQICDVLGFGNIRQALATHCDPEDVCKIEMQTNGGKQSVNCVNESGLYALIFGSKLPKAKEFKKFVTSEVLPAIRKQGAYVSDQLTYEQALKIVEERQTNETALITYEQQYEISSHVVRKTLALFGNRNYSAVYQALKRRFRIPRYSCLLQSDYETALQFIDSLTRSDFGVPELEKLAPAIPDGALVLSKGEAEYIRDFVYFWRYGYRPALVQVYAMLQAVGSPITADFFNTLNDPSLVLVEKTLEKHGMSVKDSTCYKRLIVRNS